MKRFILGGVAVLLMMPVFASAAQYDHEAFRFPREQSVTKDGYPTPLSGQPITKTPVIVKKTGVTLKKYPEHYIPGKEPLADKRDSSNGTRLREPHSCS